jgi:uncharacterized membrane protein YccC
MPKSNRNLLANLRPGRLDWPVVIHSLRTAVAAIASVAAARLARLPEAYWAPVTTLVIVQSSLGAAMAVSRERFAGTALGAALSALVASYCGPRILVFGGCVFLMGFLCALAHLDQSAYRFGGVTLAIVLLIPRGSARLEDRFQSLCRGIHRNRGGSAFGNIVAGKGKSRRGEAMNFL